MRINHIVLLLLLLLASWLLAHHHNNTNLGKSSKWIARHDNRFQVTEG